MHKPKQKREKEIEFIEAFCKKYNEFYGQAKFIKKSNQSKYADCEIMFWDELIKLECKLFNDTRNNSSKFYNLLGELIGTYTKSTLIGQNPLKFPKLGILISKKHETEFNKLWEKNIDLHISGKYCTMLNLDYLVIFSNSTKNIEIKKYNFKTNYWDKVEDMPQKVE